MDEIVYSACSMSAYLLLKGKRYLLKDGSTAVIARADDSLDEERRVHFVYEFRGKLEEAVFSADVFSFRWQIEGELTPLSQDREQELDRIVATFPTIRFPAPSDIR